MNKMLGKVNSHDALSRSDSETLSRSDSETLSRSDSETLSRSDSETLSRSDSETLSISDNKTSLRSGNKRAKHCEIILSESDSKIQENEKYIIDINVIVIIHPYINHHHQSFDH
jgi:hypothetical protein